MTIMRRFAAGLLLGILASACASGSSTSNSASPVKGGTLHITYGDDVDFLDTADAYSPVSWALERAYARTLYAYQSSRDALKAATPAPYLAAAPPKVTGNGTIYTFKLRQGVQW